MDRHTTLPFIELNEMKKKVIGFCVTAWVCTSISAQDVQNDTVNIQNLDEVVVSDSRFELKREHSGKTVIKITAEELERYQGKSVAEIINTKSGLEITGSRGREGTILGVFARGGRGRQVLILIDGVRVSDPSSSSSEYDLRLLSAANIESIEIIKGAASTLYGTNAATAVINITTKNESKRKVALNVKTSRGTNQTVEDQNYNLSNAFNGINVSGTVDKFTYQVGFTNRYSDGLSALVTSDNMEDVFSTFSTDVKLGYQFSNSFKVKVFGNHTKLRTDYDESFGMIDAPYQFISEQKRAGLSSELKYNNGSLNLNAAFNDFNSENISAFPGTFKGQNYLIDLFNKLTINNMFYSILGLNYLKDQTEFEATTYFTILDPYVNVVYVSDIGLNLNIGARLNNHSEYGSHLVYNLNPSFSFKTNTGYFKFLGSYATSYITPSLTQLFGNFGANPELGPEENRTLEGGMEYAVSSKLRLNALYFNRKEENAVIYDNLTGLYANASSNIDAQGVEFEFNWNPSEKIGFSSNYTFTERKGDAAIRIPKHKVNASFGYELTERSYTSVVYSYTGVRTDTDFSAFENIELPNFSLLDLYFAYDLIPKKMKVFVGASNLLNTEYVEIIGFTTRGRNFNGGMNLTL